MPEQNDKELHDWVRQTLNNYQPAYNPHDWQLMQRKLRYRQWWLKGSAGFVAMMITGSVLWWVLSAGITQEPVTPVASETKTGVTHTETHTEAEIEENNPPILLSGDSTAADLADVQKNTEPSHPYKKSGLMAPLPANMYHLRITGLQEHLQLPIEPLQLPLYSLEESAIQQQMLSGQFGNDSASYQALARNLHRWPDAAVVCDFTTSMYPYSTQVFTWFRHEARRPKVQGIVFFTDCDSTGQETRSLHTAGQMFVSTQLEPDQVLPVMIQAARNTVNNHNSEENDIEALLYAQQAFPEAKHLVLLADNSSAVKDMALLDKIKKPVHVILCGAPGDTSQAFQPEYLQIAAQTGGSLHTIEDDLKPENIQAGTWLRIGERYYRYSTRKKQFIVSHFRYRPKRYLGILWF